MLCSWLALDLYCPCSSTKVPAVPISPVLQRGGRQWFVSGVWALAGTVLGTHRAAKHTCVSAGTNRPAEVTDNAHLLKGGTGWVSNSESPHFLEMMIWKLSFHSTG